MVKIKDVDKINSAIKRLTTVKRYIDICYTYAETKVAIRMGASTDDGLHVPSFHLLSVLNAVRKEIEVELHGLGVDPNG